MMQQFLESLQAQAIPHLPPHAPKTPESNKRPIDNSDDEEVNNNPGSEKRQDDRPTPAKLFNEDMDLSDSATDTDAKNADASQRAIDDDL
jgi:hypothetical protein